MNRYAKGRRKEYEIMKRCKAEGDEVVLRSAGSHSKVDVVAINFGKKRIRLFQSKGDISDGEKRRILEEVEGISGVYIVTFDVV